MITKRNGYGQTECFGCKEKGKFSLNWDSFLYNFDDKPYCLDCLMEKLEELQQRIDKAIEYIIEFTKYDLFDSTLEECDKNYLLEILKGTSE